MVEKDIIIKEKIKHKGLGNFKDSYKYARLWLEEEDYKVIEDNYTEKIVSNGKEIEIKWIATKKITEYYKINFELKWKILGLVDVEVEVDGQRKKMNKYEELKIELKGMLEKDYESQWEISPLYRFMKEIYQKYVIIERTREKEKEVEKDVQDFKEEMKAFLDLMGRKEK